MVIGLAGVFWALGWWLCGGMDRAVGALSLFDGFTVDYWWCANRPDHEPSFNIQLLASKLTFYYLLASPSCLYQTVACAHVVLACLLCN
jgi:hypothetical protein